MDTTLELVEHVAEARRPAFRLPRVEPPLRIWHVGASNSPWRVNGVNTAVWLIADSQKALGHEVHLPVLEAVKDGIEGLHTHVLPTFAHRFLGGPVRDLVRGHTPDVVHIHSAFIPRHTWLGRTLRDLGVPYVLTPHGALFPEVLERGRLKKALYTRLLEREHVRNAAGVTALTPFELEHIHDYAVDDSGGRPPIGRVIFNPIAMRADDEKWSYRSGRASVVFLGRFDVETKGIDRLVAIARLLPHVDFHLYGYARNEQAFRLMASSPENVRFHDPIFGSEKRAMLSRASIYLQPSRWEAFSLSASEAMACGVPCVMSENLHLTRLLVREKAVLPMDDDVQIAAEQIASLLGDVARLHDLSERGRSFIRTNCSPLAIARQYVSHYRHVIRK